MAIIKDLDERIQAFLQDAIESIGTPDPEDDGEPEDERDTDTAA